MTEALAPVPEPLTLESARELLKQRTLALLTATPKNIAALTRDIQALRIICQTLSELADNSFSPNTYREIALLNRMVLSHDLGSETSEEEATRAVEVAARLEKKGISADSAFRLARVLSSVGASMTLPEDLDEKEDEE